MNTDLFSIVSAILFILFGTGYFLFLGLFKCQGKNSNECINPSFKMYLPSVVMFALAMFLLFHK
jgi:lipopolysaccharide export LptBFGC system permease protein LptF